MNSNKQRKKTQEGFEIFRFIVVISFSFVLLQNIFVFTFDYNVLMFQAHNL